MGTKILTWTIVVVLVQIKLGDSKPYSTIGVGNAFKIEHRSSQFSSPFGIQFVTRSQARRPTLPNHIQSATSTLKPRFYILRKKPTKQQQPANPIQINPEVSYSFYETGAGDSLTDEYSSSLLTQQTEDIRRVDDLSAQSSDQQTSGVSDWISLDEVANAFKISPEKLDNTPIYTDTPNNANTFQSNIALPHNPFLSNEAFMRSDGASALPNSDAESIAMPQVDLTEQRNYPNPAAEKSSVNPEQSLQRVLNKYLDDLYKSKSSAASGSPVTGSDLFYASQDSSSSSRLDNFPFLDIPSLKKKPPISPVTEEISPVPSVSHYTKPGSSTSFIPISIENSATAPAAHEKAGPAPVVHKEAQSRESTGHTDFTTVGGDVQQFQQQSAYLTKVKKLQHLSEVFPPQGSYTPYGEQTIVMLKYPGLPQTEKSSGFEIDLTSRWKNMWKPTNSAKAEPGSPDFGVIISQNHILQPDPFAQSTYKGRSDFSELNSVPGGDLVPQLAKALAERNRIINTYSSSPLSKGKNVETRPPFVLIHLESFTKKANKSSSFGFDDIVEKNYANGTIIYPTKNNPSILASTKFEFETLDDVENIFGRPLEGYHNGAMKPIVPLGLADIRSYLKLMYEVHTDIHEGGKTKLDELRKLSINSPRQSFPNSREMNDWEIQRSRGMLNDNWLHTSSIGLRSLSGDHSSAQIPSPPIVTYGNANSLFQL